MCTPNSLRRMPALRGLFAKKLHLCEKLIYSRKRELVFNLKKFFICHFFWRETKSLKSFCLPLGWNPIYMGLKMHNSKLLKTIRGSHSHFFTHSHTHPLSPLPLVCLSLSLSFSNPSLSVSTTFSLSYPGFVYLSHFNLSIMSVSRIAIDHFVYYTSWRIKVFKLELIWCIFFSFNPLFCFF